MLILAGMNQFYTVEAIHVNVNVDVIVIVNVIVNEDVNVNVNVIVDVIVIVNEDVIVIVDVNEDVIVIVIVAIVCRSCRRRLQSKAIWQTTTPLRLTCRSFRPVQSLNALKL